jgi:hydrogenase nickel incorporation protein HypA/HybF
MHELAVTREIVRAVEEELSRLPDGARLVKVKLTLGRLTGYVPESIEFCYAALTEGGRLAGSELDIERRDGRVRCEGCGEEFTLDEPYFICPNCGGRELTVLGGREFLITGLEVEEGS